MKPFASIMFLVASGLMIAALFYSHDISWALFWGFVGVYNRFTVVEITLEELKKRIG